MESNNVQSAGFAAKQSPFIGLTEAIVWIATRDDEYAQVVADASRGPGATKVAEWIGLSNECQARAAPTPEGAFKDLSDAAAIGRLSSRGRNGAGGFEIIPADDWIEAELECGADPDAFKPVGSPGWIFGTVWTHVRFARADVLRLWPALPSDTVDAPSPRLRPVPKPRRGAKPGPKPPWADKLATIFNTHHKRIVEANMSERERHKFVHKFFLPTEDKPSSPRTTARHWDSHLERRAHDSR